MATPAEVVVWTPRPRNVLRGVPAKGAGTKVGRGQKVAGAGAKVASNVARNSPGHGPASILGTALSSERRLVYWFKNFGNLSCKFCIIQFTNGSFTDKQTCNSFSNHRQLKPSFQIQISQKMDAVVPQQDTNVVGGATVSLGPLTFQCIIVCVCNVFFIANTWGENPMLHC